MVVATTSWALIDAAFRAFLLTTGKSPETARTYTYSTHIFFRWADDHELDPECAGRPVIEEYITDQIACVSRFAARNRLLALRSYYNFLISKGERQDNPTLGLTVKKPKVYPKQPVGMRDMRKLVYGAHSPRDAAIVLMLASTGIRIGELVSMRIENIRWEEGLVLIEGKGSKERLVAPGEETMQALRDVIGIRRRGSVWLTKDGKPLSRDRARQNFYRLAQRQDVRAHPHQLRATFANMFLEDGGDLGALQSALGHADISTTNHYAGASRQQRGLQFMAKMDVAARIL